MARRQGRNREREGERKKGQRGEGKGGGEKYARSMGMRRPLRRAQWQVGEMRSRKRDRGHERKEMVKRIRKREGEEGREEEGKRK